MLRNNFLILLFLFFSISLSAETCDSIRVIQKGSQSFVEYKVDKGNTLYYLSRRFNCSVEDIKARNSIEVLQVNSIIYIPIKHSKRIYDIPNGVGKKSHIVRENETLYGISKFTNVSVQNIKKYNGLTTNEISVGQTLKLLPDESKTTPTDHPKITGQPNTNSTPKLVNEGQIHIVQKGETLYSISKTKGLEVERIKALNHLTSNQVSIGQTLKLPIATQKLARTQTSTMLNSNHVELDQKFTEVICPKGKVGEIVKLVHPATQLVVYARITKISEDHQIYATKKAFEALGSSDFSTSVYLTYCP